MWTTSKFPSRSSRRGATTPPAGNGARFETAPLAENPGGASQRHEVVGEIDRFRRGTVKHPADPVGGVDGSKNSHMMAAAEKLLGKGLNVLFTPPGMTRNMARLGRSARATKPRG